MFDHEKFEAYQIAIKYWETVLDLIDNLPPGNSGLKDQLKRAASSIPLNLAEGCGRSGNDDRKRFYSIARGSAMECAAIADLVLTMHPQYSNRIAQSKKYLHSIVCILSTIILK